MSTFTTQSFGFGSLLTASKMEAQWGNTNFNRVTVLNALTGVGTLDLTNNPLINNPTQINFQVGSSGQVAIFTGYRSIVTSGGYIDMGGGSIIGGANFSPGRAWWSGVVSPSNTWITMQGSDAAGLNWVGRKIQTTYLVDRSTLVNSTWLLQGDFQSFAFGVLGSEVTNKVHEVLGSNEEVDIKVTSAGVLQIMANSASNEDIHKLTVLLFEPNSAAI